MIGQIYIRLCFCSVLYRLYNQEYIGKYRIIVFVIMKVAVRTALVLVANVMKICFYGKNKNMDNLNIKIHGDIEEYSYGQR